MPSVFPYTNADELLEKICNQISHRVRNGRLEALKIVVPSVYFRNWLQIGIARRMGICMGLVFSMPQDFVKEVFEAAGIQKAGEWSKRRLEWSVFEHCEGFPGVDAKAAARDRFAMARSVADRLDQYAHFRPEMIKAWTEGKAFQQQSDDERWQRALWNKLFEKCGNDPGLLPERLQNADAAAKLKVAFSGVTVIGSGSLDPLLLHILGILSNAGVGVDVHVILPCLGYLADLRDQTKNQVPPCEGDPENFEIGEEPPNPLLVSMARHAAGAFVLLGNLDDEYPNWPEPTEIKKQTLPGNPNLLLRLQDGVRANTAYEKVALTDSDPSLSVHECYGPRRELEVLRDEILRAYAENPKLKPEEILIATPSLEIYAPLVPAVFNSGEIPLPVRLTEIPPGEGDSVCEGLLAVLGIAHGSRGRASEILDLLQLRAVRACLGLEDDEKNLEVLSDSLRNSGLTQGFLEPETSEPGGWRFSLNRLIAGEFFGPYEPDPFAQDGFQLPIADMMGSNLPLTARFHEWLYGVHDTLLKWQKPATPCEWAERLESATIKLLGGEEERMATAARHIAFLKELQIETPIDCAVMLDWLAPEVEESNRRAPFSGAMLFGRLKQLHNTPCRVLALVGMQNDSFPARSSTPSWDLLRAKPKIWDRNARVDDRQMFLDSVLAPFERLIITASTLNIRTNKTQPLSTCVEELLSAAATLGVPREAIIRKHPLQPFSAKYFADAKDRGNLSKPFGKAAARLAEQVLMGNRVGAPLHVGSDVSGPEMPRKDVTIDQLISFWKDPAKAFLKAQKIAATFGEADDRDLDLSPLSLNTLQSWKIKDAILAESLSKSGNIDLLKDRLRADRLLPPGALGEIAWEENLTLVEPIASKLKAIIGDRQSVELEINGCRVIGALPLSSDNNALIACRVGKMDKAEHFITPWIMAVFASAAGFGLPTILVDETLAEPLPIKDAITQQEAEEALRRLVEGYFEGLNRPLCYAPMTSNELIESLEKARKEWGREDQGYGGGEGQKESAKLAWRDSEPFAHISDWERWQSAVAMPLKKWGGF
jgi:exodeoxyribonuclease V gamma subunit